MLRHLDNDSKEDASLGSCSPSAGASGSQLALRAASQHVRTSFAQQEDVSRGASCSSERQQQQQQALLRVLCRSMAQVQVVERRYVSSMQIVHICMFIGAQAWCSTAVTVEHLVKPGHQLCWLKEAPQERLNALDWQCRCKQHVRLSG